MKARYACLQQLILPNDCEDVPRLVLTKYFWISSEPTTLRNVAEVWLATALASSVLPETQCTIIDKFSSLSTRYKTRTFHTRLRHSLILQTSKWMSGQILTSTSTCYRWFLKQVFLKKRCAGMRITGILWIPWEMRLEAEFAGFLWGWKHVVRLLHYWKESCGILSEMKARVLL